MCMLKSPPITTGHECKTNTSGIDANSSKKRALGRRCCADPSRYTLSMAIGPLVDVNRTYSTSIVTQESIEMREHFSCFRYIMATLPPRSEERATHATAYHAGVARCTRISSLAVCQVSVKANMSSVSSTTTCIYNSVLYHKVSITLGSVPNCLGVNLAV